MELRAVYEKNTGTHNFATTQKINNKPVFLLLRVNHRYTVDFRQAESVGNRILFAFSVDHPAGMHRSYQITSTVHNKTGKTENWVVETQKHKPLEVT
ncbi:hypothetical protein BaRGS_00020478 [Batillaria attramentaria]|uniref:Uncharacterized protein n=1 Tax=Batillaria attramentaria TaxID=370345 RepID=A0ABD0KMQ3_9CAEN